jgi:parvulin-like peptidyl-prolyl isomerase
MRSITLVPLILILVACGPTATPVVIRNSSVAQTRTAAVAPTITPTGPTAEPTITPTPYTRPTDDPALRLDHPIVRIGTETITLGQYRRRVRFERWLSLDSAHKVIKELGLPKLIRDPGQNKALEYVMAIFNTLSNSSAFGHQVYNNMIRESILRQEFKTRGLTFTDQEIRTNWIGLLGLQSTPDLDTALQPAIDTFIATASNYSGLSRVEIEQIAQLQIISDKLRPLIIKEIGDPAVLTFQLRHILTNTQAEAEAALSRIKQGETFRAVACEASIDPATRGENVELIYTSKSKFIAGLQNTDVVFRANAGDIVGPLQGPSGWYLIQVKDHRTNPDGDTEVAARHIIVATQTLATEIIERAQKGEAFNKLACLYSLDKSISTAGLLTNVDPSTLLADINAALRDSKVNDVLGPFSTPNGFELYLVEDRKLTILKPNELEQVQLQAYVDWQTQRANSNFVVTLSDTWKRSIPTDPLPRDVSPLMVEQNFGLPTPQPTLTTTANK